MNILLIVSDYKVSHDDDDDDVKRLCNFADVVYAHTATLHTNKS